MFAIMKSKRKLAIERLRADDAVVRVNFLNFRLSLHFLCLTGVVKTRDREVLHPQHAGKLLNSGYGDLLTGRPSLQEVQEGGEGLYVGVGDDDGGGEVGGGGEQSGECGAGQCEPGGGDTEGPVLSSHHQAVPSVHQERRHQPLSSTFVSQNHVVFVVCSVQCAPVHWLILSS